MKRKKLTANFYADEFQCPCCGLNNISMDLVNLIQKIREGFGRKIIVTSGTRCEKHNELVGGKGGSDHVIGYAADIDCEDAMDRRELMILAFAAGLPTVGVNKTFLHLSIGVPARVFTYE